MVPKSRFGTERTRGTGNTLKRIIDSSARFPGSGSDAHVTEYGSTCTYIGNGPGRVIFLLLR